ncbi:MAG TPA: TIM barrel protein [Chloroflexi bacterium]|jgi:sugar phosphate isomerase/epimerase|nr:TIM barrel protein [Chloroflexota bacterium]
MKWAVEVGNVGDGTPEGAARYCLKLGLEGVSLPWARVPGFEEKGYLEAEAIAPIRKKIEDMGVEFAPMVAWAPRDLPKGEEAGKHFANLRRSFEAMAAVGVDTLIMFPPGRPDSPWDEIVAYYRELIKIAEEFNIRIALHNHGQFKPVKVLKRLMEDVPSPLNGVCLCSGNSWHGDGEAMYDTMRELAGKIFFVHVRNVKTGEGEKEYWLEQGDVDLPRFIKVLKEMGYDGYVRSEHLPTDMYRTHEPEVAGVSDIGTAYSVGYLRAYMK